MTESGVMGQGPASSSSPRDSILSLSKLTRAGSDPARRDDAGTADYPYRAWEDVYRNKWRWERVVKGTCNRADCIAACSLDLYVRDGMVWREEQATVYEQTNPSFPDFNPRGCQKGMCYSDLMYEPSRIKYPLKRVGERGSGRWQRISWDEATSEIADAILDACVEDGPESVVYDCGTTNVDFGPGTPAEIRLVQLIGTTYLDEWASVGDLPMGAIQTWGLFNAEGTSDDWFNSDYILVWLGNPVYTRVPDVHFMWEARYHGAKVVSIAPDYNATTLHADLWINPRIGTDTALALGMAQAIVGERLYDEGHIKEQTDLPLLIRDDTSRFLRQQDMQAEGQDDIFYFWDSASGGPVEASGSYGHPGESISLNGIEPALEGSFRVTLADGRTVTVRPAFERLKERLAEYSPERASEISGVHPNIIRKVAREIAGAKAAMIFASWGACKHYHMDLTQRAMILLLALSGHVGKPGGGLRIGAWWQMTLNYDPNPPALPPGRPLVRDVEKMMKSMTEIWTTTSPTMVWLYAHDEGFARIVNESAYHDPALPREVAEYAREAIEKRWMPVHPKPGIRPRVFLYTGMNPLRRWPAPHVIRDHLWANMKLIVCWDFRMSTSAMYSDIVLPAAGWHEKAGVKFAQSYVPYICVGDEAVAPLYESKNEFDIMALLAAKIQERAQEREIGSYLDATGVEHDPKHLCDEHTVEGEFGEGQALRALDTVLKRSLPTENISVEEATRKGAIRVKSAGYYGPLTAICSDLERDQPLHPFDWFVRDKEPWPTLTGRQQFYIDHPWYLEVGEELPVHKAEPKAGGDYPLRMSGGHTRWSIHAIWRTNRLMLRLQRGQPVAYVNPKDAQARGISDHDQVWIYNDIGGFKVHAKLAPGVQPGEVIIYHAWEPYQFERWMGSQTVVPSAFKPLHLVGDYGHLQYRFALGQPSHVCRNMSIEMDKA